MFKSTFFKSILLLSFFLVLATSSYADKRSYVWTYEYLTLEPGNWEIEYYNTLSTTDASHFRGNTSTTHQIELEVGMTEHFDFAVYQVFSQVPGAGFNYDGFKLRSRFKIGEKGEFFVDPLIYLEYIASPDLQNNEIEAKLILARDFGKFNISLNPILACEKNGAEEWEFTPEYALGFNYSFSELFTLGLESTGSDKGIYLGPTITHGNKDVWVGISPMFAMNDVDPGRPEFKLRMILAFGK